MIGRVQETTHRMPSVWRTVATVTCLAVGGILAACGGRQKVDTYGLASYTADFSSPDELNNWKCFDQGKWEIRDGALIGDARGTANGRSILWLQKPLAEDVQVEYEAECLDAPSDLNCFICGNGKEYSGYEVIVGGFGNEKIAVYKCAVDGDDTSRNRLTRESFSVQQGKVYGIKIKKYRGEFRVYVDEELMIQKSDNDPISDHEHRYFGFSTFKTVVRFDNLKIEKKE